MKYLLFYMKVINISEVSEEVVLAEKSGVGIRYDVPLIPNVLQEIYI